MNADIFIKTILRLDDVFDIDKLVFELSYPENNFIIDFKSVCEIIELINVKCNPDIQRTFLINLNTIDYFEEHTLFIKNKLDILNNNSRLITNLPCEITKQKLIDDLSNENIVKNDIAKYYKNLTKDDPDMTEYLITKINVFDYPYNTIIANDFYESFQIIFDNDKFINNATIMDSICRHKSERIFDIIIKSDKIDILNKLQYIDQSYEKEPNIYIIKIINKIINEYDYNLPDVLNNNCIYKSIDIMKKLFYIHNDIVDYFTSEYIFINKLMSVGSIDVHKFIIEEIGSDKFNDLIQDSVEHLLYNYDDVIEYYMDNDEFIKHHHKKIIEYLIITLYDVNIDLIKKIIKKTMYTPPNNILFNIKSLEVIRYFLETFELNTEGLVNKLYNTFTYSSQLIDILKYMKYERNIHIVDGYKCLINLRLGYNFPLMKYLIEDENLSFPEWFVDNHKYMYFYKFKYDIVKYIVVDQNIDLNTMDHFLKNIFVDCSDIIVTINIMMLLHIHGHYNLDRFVEHSEFKTILLTAYDIIQNSYK